MPLCPCLHASAAKQGKSLDLRTKGGRSHACKAAARERKRSNRARSRSSNSDWIFTCFDCDTSNNGCWWAPAERLVGGNGHRRAVAEPAQVAHLRARGACAHTIRRQIRLDLPFCSQARSPCSHPTPSSRAAESSMGMGFSTQGVTQFRVACHACLECCPAGVPAQMHQAFQRHPGAGTRRMIWQQQTATQTHR